MGEHTETVAADTGFRSCETNYVGVSSQEDRSRPEGTVGEG
ncbi:MAG TPA: hypothetical protein VK828_17440 [Terriglobales bacterium]|jgi:hypothetical protein|nr:hypothetical protein [Terriglobales bacterium]